MKLSRLYVDGYKNLKSIEIFFKENSSVNALIGNNGSGKSNILEALVKVFISVIEGIELDFIYDIEYLIDDDKYKLSNNPEVIFLKNGKKVSSKDRLTAVPRGIFLYYCGETDRLEKLSGGYVDKAFNKALKIDDEVTIKYISYIKLQDFGAALLSNAIYKNETFERVCDLLGIEEIGAPIIIKLHRPYWSKSAKITQDSFWNAQGTVAILLHSFKDIGEFKIVDDDNAEIIITNFSDFKNLAENPFDIFIKFKLLMQADILNHLEFDVIENGMTVSINELSEGEKQLAQLLSILEATKEYRALFLLDEFDSYLHPNWQRKFAEIISDINIRGQVLFTTHSPLTLGKMQKENIRILKDGEVFEPAVDTYNRDITEVLEEIMDVGKRPIEVENTLIDFKQQALSGNKNQAATHYETLKELLSEDDPFWSVANNLMSRLER